MFVLDEEGPPSWMSSGLVGLRGRPRKKGVLALSTHSPRSSVLTVLNIVINFNSDNSNARLLGNSLAVVPIISVRERLLSDLQSFNSGFQWQLEQTIVTV
jgi:hypothetical protein